MQVRAKAPGRVNLIGEHIDYSGFSVLPCAIARSVRVCASLLPLDSEFLFIVSNQNSQFEMRNFKEIAFSAKHWSDYPLAALCGIAAYAGRILPKMQLTIDGNIPAAAGLSSSSALVVASALAIAELCNLKISGVEMAQICADSERLTGTAGGGMDQAIIMLAKKNYAMHVQFVPRLLAVPVKIPGKFIAANSLVESAKAVHATRRFNRRVLECKVAAHILGGATLREAMYNSNKSFAEMLGIVQESLPDVILAAEIMSSPACQNLQLDTRLHEALTSAIAAGDFLHLRPRARHVYSEAARVDQFIVSASEDNITAMGKLMDESMQSCAQDYDCSCPDLDQLAQLLRDAGALGSRLTGAGWGGFVIALFPLEQKNALIAVKQVLATSYYNQRNVEELDDVVFEFEPSEGACVAEGLDV